MRPTTLAVGTPVASPVADPTWIRAAAIWSIARFLSDDLLEGRFTASRGHEIATRFIAEHLQMVGIEPLGDSGTWLAGIAVANATARPVWSPGIFSGRCSWGSRRSAPSPTSSSHTRVHGEREAIGSNRRASPKRRACHHDVGQRPARSSSKRSWSPVGIARVPAWQSTYGRYKMTNLSKRILGGTIAVSLLTVSVLAYAGTKTYEPVYISTQYSYAYGGIGDARASSDTTQYIGCENFANNGGATPSGYCFAQDTLGHYETCTWSGAAPASAIASLSGSSFITFSWNSSGQCGYVRVDTSSYYTPPVP